MGGIAIGSGEHGTIVTSPGGNVQVPFSPVNPGNVTIPQGTPTIPMSGGGGGGGGGYSPAPRYTPAPQYTPAPKTSTSSVASSISGGTISQSQAQQLFQQQQARQAQLQAQQKAQTQAEQQRKAVQDQQQSLSMAEYFRRQKPPEQLPIKLGQLSPINKTGQTLAGFEQFPRKEIPQISKQLGETLLTGGKQLALVGSSHISQLIGREAETIGQGVRKELPGVIRTVLPGLSRTPEEINRGREMVGLERIPTREEFEKSKVESVIGKDFTKEQVMPKSTPEESGWIRTGTALSGEQEWSKTIGDRFVTATSSQLAEVGKEIGDEEYRAEVARVKYLGKGTIPGAVGQLTAPIRLGGERIGSMIPGPAGQFTSQFLGDVGSGIALTLAGPAAIPIGIASLTSLGFYAGERHDVLNRPVEAAGDIGGAMLKGGKIALTTPRGLGTTAAAVATTLYAQQAFKREQPQRQIEASETQIMKEQPLTDTLKELWGRVRGIGRAKAEGVDLKAEMRGSVYGKSTPAEYEVRGPGGEVLVTGKGAVGATRTEAVGRVTGEVPGPFGTTSLVDKLFKLSGKAKDIPIGPDEGFGMGSVRTQEIAPDVSVRGGPVSTETVSWINKYSDFVLGSKTGTIYTTRSATVNDIGFIPGSFNRLSGTEALSAFGQVLKGAQTYDISGFGEYISTKGMGFGPHVSTVPTKVFLSGGKTIDIGYRSARQPYVGQYFTSPEYRVVYPETKNYFSFEEYFRPSDVDITSSGVKFISSRPGKVPQGTTVEYVSSGTLEVNPLGIKRMNTYLARNPNYPGYHNVEDTILHEALHSRGLPDYYDVSKTKMSGGQVKILDAGDRFSIKPDVRVETERVSTIINWKKLLGESGMTGNELPFTIGIQKEQTPTIRAESPLIAGMHTVFKVRDVPMTSAPPTQNIIEIGPGGPVTTTGTGGITQQISQTIGGFFKPFTVKGGSGTIMLPQVQQMEQPMFSMTPGSMAAGLAQQVGIRAQQAAVVQEAGFVGATSLLKTPSPQMVEQVSFTKVGRGTEVFSSGGGRISVPSGGRLITEVNPIDRLFRGDVGVTKVSSFIATPFKVTPMTGGLTRLQSSQLSVFEPTTSLDKLRPSVDVGKTRNDVTPFMGGGQVLRQEQLLQQSTTTPSWMPPQTPFSFPEPSPPGVGHGTPSGLGIGLAGFGLGGRGAGRQTKYLPSIGAKVFSIFAPKAPQPAGGFTGLEIRPIIPQVMRRGRVVEKVVKKKEKEKKSPLDYLYRR